MIGLWRLTPLQHYFSYIVAVSLIGGGNRSTRRKPPTCRKSDKRYHIMVYTRYEVIDMGFGGCVEI